MNRHGQPSARQPHLFGVLAALSLLGLLGCSSEGKTPEDGVFPSAESDCATCVHVVRDLEFVREIALSGDLLYVADTDGTRLDRINVADGSEMTLVRGEYSPLFLSVTPTHARFLAVDFDGVGNVIQVAHDSTTLEVLASYDVQAGSYVGVRGARPILTVREDDGTHLWEMGPDGPTVDEGLLTQLGNSSCVAVSLAGALAWCDAEDGFWVVENQDTPLSAGTHVPLGAKPYQVSWLGESAVVSASEGGTFRAWTHHEGNTDLLVETADYEGMPVARSGNETLFVDTVMAELWRVAPGTSPQALSFTAPLFLGDVPLAADENYAYVGGRGPDGGQVYRLDL